MRRFATARLSRSSQRGARYRCEGSELTPGQSRRVFGQTGAHRVCPRGTPVAGRAGREFVAIAGLEEWLLKAAADET